jgi:hypothetical protein
MGNHFQKVTLEIMIMMPDEGIVYSLVVASAV